MVAGLAALVLFAWFHRLERRGDAATVVIFVLVLVVIDSALYGGTGQNQYGVFRPGIGGGPLRFRLPELVIPLALAARVAVRGTPRRLSTTTLWWWSFFAWMLLGTFVGLRSGHNVEQVLFEGKAIIYVGGAMALGAGVPATDYVGERGLCRLVLGLTPFVVLVLGINMLGLDVTGGPPGFRVVGLGREALPADPATVFTSLGLLGLLVALSQARPRRSVVLASLLLVGAPLAGAQRAALLGMAISVVVAAVALLGSRSGRRITVAPTDALLFALAGLLAVFVPTFMKATEAPTGIVVPFAGDVSQAFSGQGNEQSAQARLNQWEKAGEQVREQPVRGWGLGKTFTYFDPGLDEFFTANITHNIGIDLLLRMGFIGLALFSIALGCTLRDGWRASRRHRDPRVAALALGCVAAVIGLVAKGMVESIFEKYLLATLLGLLLGILRAASTAPPPKGAERDGEHDQVDLHDRSGADAPLAVVPSA